MPLDRCWPNVAFVLLALLFVVYKIWITLYCNIPLLLWPQLSTDVENGSNIIVSMSL